MLRRKLRELDRRRGTKAAGTLGHAGNASPRPRDAEGAEDDEGGVAVHGKRRSGVRRHRSSPAPGSATPQALARCAAPTPPRDGFASGAVVGVDLHVVVAEIAGPHSGLVRAAVQADAQGDLALLHDALAVFLAIGGTAAAALAAVGLAAGETSLLR